MGTESVQIEGVITQGEPHTNTYVTKYKVQYSLDGITWLYVNETSTPQVRVFSKYTLLPNLYSL